MRGLVFTNDPYQERHNALLAWAFVCRHSPLLQKCVNKDVRNLIASYLIPITIPEQLEVQGGAPFVLIVKLYEESPTFDGRTLLRGHFVRWASGGLQSKAMPCHTCMMPCEKGAVFCRRHWADLPTECPCHNFVLRVGYMKLCFRNTVQAVTDCQCPFDRTQMSMACFDKHKQHGFLLGRK